LRLPYFEGTISCRSTLDNFPRRVHIVRARIGEPSHLERIRQ
jgi:hypothetical protein